MRSRILVVGRDVAARARLARTLTSARYAVELAESAAQARQLERKNIALAIVAPEGLGREADAFIDGLRDKVGQVLLASAVPGAREREADILDISDEAGLLARVAEALRPAADPEPAEPVLQFSGYTLDLAGHSLADASGRDIPLTRNEFALLSAFAQRAGRVVSRDTLLQLLAGREAESFDRSIDMLIVRLRRKIEPDPKRPSLIVTIPGSGYKFAAKVRRAESITETQPAATPPDIAPAAAPERRYVTALAAELIGPLPGDPEELHSVVATWRRYARAVITRHGGSIGHCVGRDVLAWFGYPVAQEHAAERALRAGLALAEHLAEGEMALPEGLAVRVGVASGLVLADPGGEMLGETPSEAARLHELAEPGQVIVTASTRQMAGELFAYRELGPLTQTGIADSVPAWQVLGPSALASHSEALHAHALMSLVGREEELAQLRRAWQQAKSGEGRLVLLSGEPGIGKSRLLAALEEELASEPHVSLGYFCSPLHQDSPLHPVIARWEQEVGFARGDTGEERLRKLERFLAPFGMPLEEVALLAAMLSVPTGERYPRLEYSPQRRKERTFAALLQLLISRAQTQPVLMLFEDAHWADPSSLELFDMVVQRLAELPILLVISYRPSFAPPWIGQASVRSIVLSRLGRRESAQLAAQMTAQDVLTPDLLDRIVIQTDGVPLFIEELTKAVLESGAQASEALSAMPYPGLSVPPTLHASLMARLDRLGSTAREVAQAGAVIGREFSYALLAAVTDLPERRLHEALDRLSNAGLVFARGTPPEASYLFKHALVQDAAYGSLLRSRRQGLHRRTVGALEQRFPDMVQAQPALLAQHCQQAGLAEQAITYWRRAAQQAIARSAMAEAVAQLQQALGVLAELPDGPQRQQQELDLQVLLTSALSAAKGFSAAEVAESLARARTLAEQLDRPESLVLLISHQYLFHLVRAEYGAAFGLAQELERIGAAPNGGLAHCLAYLTHGIVHLMRGELVAAHAALEACLDKNDPAYRTVADGLIFDPYVMALVYLAPALAYLGYLDQARSRIDAAVSEARRIKYTHALAHALLYRNWIDWLSGSPLTQTGELLTLTTKHRFPYFLGWALALHGQSSLLRGQAQDGLALLREALTQFRTIGSGLGLPTLFTWFAQARTMLGQPDEAGDFLAEAAQTIETTGERLLEAELLHRVPGDLLNKAGDPCAAEEHYRRAIIVAERQDAKLLQLRASTSLARLWRDQGRHADASGLLAPIYGWFTEGFDTPVLKEARALLDELTGAAA